MSILKTASWADIANEIESSIRNRALAPGDRLPTEYALGRRYMVNRHTVRRALSHLQAKGLVESTQGRGSFVRRPSLQFHIRKRTRFGEFARHAEATHRHDTLSLDVQPAEPAVARALGIHLGDPVVVLERLGYVNDLPVGIGLHHFSHERLPQFPDVYPKYGSITKALLELGIPDYVRVQTRIVSRLPTPRESELLSLPRHVPLLITQSINHDGLDRPLEYGDARMASDRVEIVIEPEAS